MNACSLMYGLMLAQIRRFDGLRDRFSGPRARFGMDDAITGIAAILAVAVLLYFVNRWHNRHSGKQSYNSSSAMFRELCKAHSLDRKTRQLLKRIAQWQRLTQPARLFLEPERFEPANLSPELERYLAELFELRAKLFTFEVTPESQDSMHHFAEVSSEQSEPAHAEAAKTNAAAALDANQQPEDRAEAIGAAAFSTTRLESPVSRSESDS